MSCFHPPGSSAGSFQERERLGSLGRVDATDGNHEHREIQDGRIDASSATLGDRNHAVGELRSIQPRSAAKRWDNRPRRNLGRRRRAPVEPPELENRPSQQRVEQVAVRSPREATRAAAEFRPWAAMRAVARAGTGLAASLPRAAVPNGGSGGNGDWRHGCLGRSRWERWLRRGGGSAVEPQPPVDRRARAVSGQRWRTAQRSASRPELQPVLEVQTRRCLGRRGDRLRRFLVGQRRPAAFVQSALLHVDEVLRRLRLVPETLHRSVVLVGQERVPRVPGGVRSGADLRQRQAGRPAHRRLQRILDRHHLRHQDRRQRRGGSIEQQLECATPAHHGRSHLPGRPVSRRESSSSPTRCTSPGTAPGSRRPRWRRIRARPAP